MSALESRVNPLPKNTHPQPAYLVVDDDTAFTEALSRVLRRRGHIVHTAQDAAGAIALCQAHRPERAVIDLKLEQSSGLHLIGQLRALDAAIQIVVLTGYSSISTTVEAMKLGATDYLCKPAGIDEIISAFAGTAIDPPPDIRATPPSINRLEWEHIQRVLRDNSGNISATARMLGMHRRTLQRKLGKRPVKS